MEKDTANMNPSALALPCFANQGSSRYDGPVLSEAYSLATAENKVVSLLADDKPNADDRLHYSAFLAATSGYALTAGQFAREITDGSFDGFSVKTNTGYIYRGVVCYCMPGTDVAIINRWHG